MCVCNFNVMIGRGVGRSGSRLPWWSWWSWWFHLSVRDLVAILGNISDLGAKPSLPMGHAPPLKVDESSGDLDFFMLVTLMSNIA